MRILERFRLFFFSYLTAQVGTFAREEVKGQMETYTEAFVGAFQIWLLLTVAEQGMK